MVWLAMLSTKPPSVAGGEAAASPCRVDRAWTVGGGTCEGPDTTANWLLTAVTDGLCGLCSMRGGGAPCELVSFDRWKPVQVVHSSTDGFSAGVVVRPWVQFDVGGGGGGRRLPEMRPL